MTESGLATPAPPSNIRRSLWRNRDYMLLWSGQAVSTAGAEIRSIAFPLLILAFTHSPFQAGVAQALSSLPFLASLPVGTLVDRWNRKWIMILADTGRALVWASILVAIWTKHLSIVHIYLAALLSGALVVFYSLAEGASLPNVVPQEQLAAAVAQNQIVTNAAYFAGSPLGGILYQIRNFLPFLADSVSYAASVLSLLLINTPFQTERSETPGSIVEEMRVGVGWVFAQPLVRFMVFLWGGINVMGAGFTLLIIVLARHQHAPPSAIGIILATGGVAGILGSMAAGRISRRFSFGQVAIGVGWMVALLFPLYAIAPNPVVLAAITAAIFVLPPIANAVEVSYVMTLTPDDLRGRVGSAVQTITSGTNPLGALSIGLLLQWIGPQATALALTAWLLVLAIATTLNSHVRMAQRLGEVAPT